MKQSIEQLGADVAQMLDRLDPQSSIGSTVVFQVHKTKEGVFEHNAAALTDATLKLPGCRVFGFHRHQSVFPDAPVDPVQFLIYEEWDTVRHFRTQWNSAHLRQFQIGVFDLLKSPVALDFYTGTSGTGRLLIQRTGQIKCFAANGDPVDCQGTGQDAEFGRGTAPPQPRFTDNQDGTVTDRLTGLIWLKDADTFGEVSWQQALSNARNLSSGYYGLNDGSAKGDWRLANIREMLSLIDYGESDPIIPAKHPFKNVRTAIYWTATTLAPAPRLAWMMTLGIGPTVFDIKHSPASRMWPVRAHGRVPKTGQKDSWDADGTRLAAGTVTGQDGDLQAGAAWPSPRFTPNGDGTVTDKLTELVWLANANPFGLRTWQEALNLCNSLGTGQAGLTDGSQPGDWRLPNIREAESVVDYGLDGRQNGPCLPDGHPFKTLRPSSYWTSTSVTAAPTEAMFIIYGVGPSIFESKEHPFFVWPVRDKQPRR
jgi:quinol monooxygenase YgiN